ncbi:MAG TPA: long-chain fatty acid--CoA ligase, partial [Alphaproteobacteria bacterium]|nr:long-chain fatty acid--CoA ligase [Alphaproteobacteria bacterium]
MIDLGRTLLGAAERYPDREAIVDGPTRWTYEKWFECVRHVAGGLVEVGLRPGDHLVTILKNCWQNASLHWACQLAGIVVTPINWRAKPGEIDFVLRDAEAKAVAFEMATEVAVNDTVLGRKMPRIAVGGDGDLSFNDLVRCNPIGITEKSRTQDISVMLYTSGTTGRGKGVPRSHHAERASSMAHVVQNKYCQGERILGVMPLYHTMGVRSLLSMALINGCFICQSHFDAEETLMLVEHER